MSGIAAGSRVLASWLGGGFAPGEALEINPAAQLVKVRFDDGREAWVSNMNVRAAPPQGAPGSHAPVAPAPGFGAQSSFGAAPFAPQPGGAVGASPFGGGFGGAAPSPVGPASAAGPGAAGFLASAGAALSAGVA